MRDNYSEQLLLLNKKMTELGELCETVIELVTIALLAGDSKKAGEVQPIAQRVDQLEREIETFCLKLLLHQQPVAGDLRQISAALKMITDMERIGDQAEDIAEIIPFLKGRTGVWCEDINNMAYAVIQMVRESVQSYVNQDVELAKKVVAKDDVVDEYFDKVKSSLIQMILQNISEGEYALDLLMIAKYFERIGDHAVNIAEWTEFTVTGFHEEELDK